MEQVVDLERNQGTEVRPAPEALNVMCKKLLVGGAGDRSGTEHPCLLSDGRVYGGNKGCIGGILHRILPPLSALLPLFHPMVQSPCNPWIQRFSIASR